MSDHLQHLFKTEKPDYLEDLNSLSHPPALSETEYASGDDEQHMKKASFASNCPLYLSTVDCLFYYALIFLINYNQMHAVCYYTTYWG